MSAIYWTLNLLNKKRRNIKKKKKKMKIRAMINKLFLKNSGK